MFVDIFLFSTALILSIVNAFLPYLAAKYFNPFILKCINGLTAKQRELLDEKRKLKQEQSQLSMTNDFAKYSKIQRKINVVDERLSESKEGNGSRNMIISMILPHVFKLLMGAIVVAFIIRYRHSPVMILNESIDLSPFSKIVSYPNQQHNAISVHFWVMCCSSVAKLINIKA